MRKTWKSYASSAQLDQHHKVQHDADLMMYDECGTPANVGVVCMTGAFYQIRS
jgi:hypothetical protein